MATTQPPQKSKSPQPALKSKGRKLKVDPGIAAIIAAVIGLGGIFLGRVTAPAPGTSNSSQGATSVTINSPVNGDISYQDSYSGNVANLRPGQLVWTFNQPVGQTGPGESVFPNSGPCAVNYSNHTWICRDLYVGTFKDSRTYMVCAAVISTSEALQIVNQLRSTQIWLPLASVPYVTDHSPECMSVHRI